MTQGISLIVGLGNPGASFAETRHNAGFRFLETLLDDSAPGLQVDRHCAGRVARIAIEERQVWLLEPDTFMNHSGDPVARFSRYYKIPPAEILVAHDDLDLPPGTARLKRGGGDGGHNGLHDIIEILGTADFYRLRLGIGHPGSSTQVVSYVLRKAPPAEQAIIDAAIRNARANIADIVHGRMQQAMKNLHTHKS